MQGAAGENSLGGETPARLQSDKHRALLFSGVNGTSLQMGFKRRKGGKETTSSSKVKLYCSRVI